MLLQADNRQGVPALDCDQHIINQRLVGDRPTLASRTHRCPQVTDPVLANAFRKYSSFNKAKVVRFSHNNKTKGYGFVSLQDPLEGARCLREMNGKYIGECLRL